MEVASDALDCVVSEGNCQIDSSHSMSLISIVREREDFTHSPGLSDWRIGSWAEFGKAVVETTNEPGCGD